MSDSMAEWKAWRYRSLWALVWVSLFVALLFGACLMVALCHNLSAYEKGRADALTAVRAQQQAATVALKDAEAIREAAIVAVRLATDALRVCSGEEGR